MSLSTVSVPQYDISIINNNLTVLKNKVLEVQNLYNQFVLDPISFSSQNPFFSAL